MKARGRVLAGSTLGVLLTLAAVCGVPSPLHAMHTDSLASGTLAPAAESRRETAVGPVHIGGYVEAGGRWQRSDGITERALSVALEGSLRTAQKARVSLRSRTLGGARANANAPLDEVSVAAIDVE